jgi:hypothetical protein
LFSSIVITPSLPTLSIASAILVPISSSPLAEMVPTWAISELFAMPRDSFCSSVTMASTALSMPRLSSIGLWPAATSLLPGAVDRLGEHGGGGGAVAGDVGGLAGDLLDHLRAHVLELVLELDLLGDGDAVLGDDGGAPRLLDDDVPALGPSVTFTALARCRRRRAACSWPRRRR